MNMLVSLMRAMKPKMLDSFKDYNAQKEFLAKLNNSKSITAVLKSDKNIVKTTHKQSINNAIKNNTVIVYNSNKKEIIKA